MDNISNHPDYRSMIRAIELYGNYTKVQLIDELHHPGCGTTRAEFQAATRGMLLGDVVHLEIIRSEA